MRNKIIAGNWKMNGSIHAIKNLLNQLIADFQKQPQQAICVVFPPAVYLPLVQDLLKGTTVLWGAQNVYPQESGAYTGEHSGPMLNDYRCAYVLAGHSERRNLFAESEKIVAEKYHHIKEHDMIPVLCVGETLAERQMGKTQEVLAKQLLAVLEKDSRAFRGGVLAYEPVWAIGTGQTASPEQTQEVHAFLRTFIAEYSKEDAANLPIIYGGSLNDKNAAALFSMPDVDGGLVGGASLNAQQFVEIVKCIN